MEIWMLGASCVGSLAVSSLWAGEWARRKGLNARTWGVVGATTGPLGVVAVGLRKPEAALCPHCKTPMRFEERYCATCRAIETEKAEFASQHHQGDAYIDEDVADYGVLLPHGFFETPSQQGFTAIAHAH